MRLVPTLALALAGAGLLAGGAAAKVTVVGWPGGPEETALRAVAEIYNAKPDVADENKVDLIFFSRDGFWEKLQADLAAGSDAFDANLLATYSIGRYAAFMEPIELSPEAEAVFGAPVLQTMQFDGKQYGVPTDLSLHFLYYRKDLIDALLADPAAQAKYTEIAQAKLGQALTAQGSRQLDLGRLRRHGALLHAGGQPGQPDPLRHRAADEEPALQHDGLPVAAAVLRRGLDGRGRQGHRRLRRLSEGPRALQAADRRRRHAGRTRSPTNTPRPTPPTPPARWR